MPQAQSHGKCDCDKWEMSSGPPKDSRLPISEATVLAANCRPAVCQGPCRGKSLSVTQWPPEGWETVIVGIVGDCWERDYLLYYYCIIQIHIYIPASKARLGQEQKKLTGREPAPPPP